MWRSNFVTDDYYRKPRFWGTAIAAIVFAFFLHHVLVNFLNSFKHQRQLVVAATAVTKDVPVYIEALGAVTPTYTVTVRTQINGQLLRVLFREGQLVKAGDLLAEIDPRPYEAQLIQYQGQLAHDSALLANDRLNLSRYQVLWRQNSISKQVFDTQAAQVKQDEGSVQTDKGLIASTQLNLYYCRIITPMDGRVGLRLVDPGNYVQTTDTSGIAVVNTLSPITVIFTIAEDNVPRVAKQVNLGKTLLVQAFNRSGQQLLATGTLLTMDNQIDPTTGTVKLRAQFKNEDNQLFPNQFVNVKLLVDTLFQATVIPTAAIQHNGDKSFVYLINKNNTVSVQPITTNVTSGENTVVAGVMPGQRVVSEGADKLTAGAYITIAPPSSTTAT